MTTNLYKVASGDLPLASDLDQYADMLNGVNDVGAITFAPQISPPTVTSVTATAATGTALGVGTYTYTFTYVVGYKKTNNTYVFGGETNASSTVTVTTTSGNQSVTLGSLPTSWPSTAVGLRIYRTAVGGSTEQIVTTLTAPQSSYTDTTADASLINTQPPSTNGTGMTLSLWKMSTSSDLTVGGALSVTGALTKLAGQATSGAFGVSVTLASASNVQVTSTSAQTILTFTPTTSGLYSIKCYLRVITGTTNITYTLWYADSGGSQTYTPPALNNQPIGVGSHGVISYDFEAVAGQTITFRITAGTANQVFVTAAIVGVA